MTFDEMRSSLGMLDLWGNQPYCDRAAYCWLLAHAGVQTDEVFPTPERADEVIVGELFLEDEWGWNVRRIETFLSRLQRAGLIAGYTFHMPGTWTSPITDADRGALIHVRLAPHASNDRGM